MFPSLEGGTGQEGGPGDCIAYRSDGLGETIEKMLVTGACEWGYSECGPPGDGGWMSDQVVQPYRGGLAGGGGGLLWQEGTLLGGGPQGRVWRGKGVGVAQGSL